MRGINDTTEREEVVDPFQKGMFKLFALTETKLKGQGEVSWVEVNVIISGVQEMERAREGVLSDLLHSAVVKHGCASPRILWIKFTFSRVKICVVVVYGPNQSKVEERDRFWNDMDRTLDSVENGYRLCILGDLNGWI